MPALYKNAQIGRNTYKVYQFYYKLKFSIFLFQYKNEQQRINFTTKYFLLQQEYISLTYFILFKIINLLHPPEHVI